MNIKQFIRESATRGLSHRATMQALGLGHWKFDLIIGAMGPTEWTKDGTTLGSRLTYEVSCGRFTPAQVAALGRVYERWSESRHFTVDGTTGMIVELVEHFQSPVHATIVRHRVAAGMGLRDVLITLRQ